MCYYGVFSLIWQVIAKNILLNVYLKSCIIWAYCFIVNQQAILSDLLLYTEESVHDPLYYKKDKSGVNQKMRKGELAEVVAEQTELSKDKASKAVEIVLQTITEALERNEDVTLTGFGAFKRRHRKERRGKNPQTGQEIQIPACETVSFKPGKKLKEKVNP